MTSYNNYQGKLEDLTKPDQFMYQVTATVHVLSKSKHCAKLKYIVLQRPFYANYSLR